MLQVSAAAFTKGLLALEGSSLTPILVSLVTKDASMLDAFGKVGFQGSGTTLKGSGFQGFRGTGRAVLISLVTKKASMLTYVGRRVRDQGSGVKERIGIVRVP